jgi:glycogen debranching enzyme
MKKLQNKIMKKTFIPFFFLLVLLGGCKSKQTKSPPTIIIDEMGIEVTSQQNRPISYANKEAAFYYTQSHENNHPEHAYFQGLTIAQKRVFQGYKLFLEQKELNRKLAKVWVYPHKMVRSYSLGLQETFWMADRMNLLAIEITNVDQEALVGLQLKGLQYAHLSQDKTEAYFHTVSESHQKPYFWVMVASQKRATLSFTQNRIEGRATGGYYIVVASKKEQLPILLKKAIGTHWRRNRKMRIEALINHRNTITTSYPLLQDALRWLTITTDQLVSHQRGYGIYAGLPWFAEYWGRDEFIALPGACLVNGDLSTARKILTSFANYQDTVSSSPFYGRVPNIVKMGSKDYHTTDGTPRFVIELLDYVKYSGDKAIIQQLYPYVKRSIEGALKNWTDDKGYLLHKDNETWMDARREPDKTSYSPRATRANDIQALWFEQLKAGVYFAVEMKDNASAKKWKTILERIKYHFNIDFTASHWQFIADYLDASDKPHFRLRPNQLFAFDLIKSKTLKAKALKECWEKLVYPWGTATLDQKDAFFHPYHLAWEHYHKDEAYHNGTVWPWLNGIAMQRMIEFNQIDEAFKLFENSNEQVLQMGCVGGLSENLDAYPHPSKVYPKLTGTYLQAWSNAEQLRVWSQYFLGIRPDLIHQQVTLAPRIPTSVKDLNITTPLGQNGVLKMRLHTVAHKSTYTYKVSNFTGTALLDIYPFALQKLYFTPQTQVIVEINHQQKQMKLILNATSKTDKNSITRVISPSKERLQQQQQWDEILKGIHFCIPDTQRIYPVLQNK